MNTTELRLAGALLAAMLAGACGSSDRDVATAVPPSAGDPDPACAPAQPLAGQIPDSPLFVLDPIGPLSDVSCDWTHYQPADAFCVKLDAPELTPGGSGTLTDGSDPACAFAGFAPEDTGLYKVAIQTPPLCNGCRRFFIDLSQMPAENGARGHAFYAIASFNPTYTINPFAHSPNTKNFTNDYFVSPPGTPLATVVNALDHYFKAYVTHTIAFAHTALQGPFYIGPWYVNREGERIHGVYVDVDVVSATDLGDANLNALRYVVGYNDGSGLCPDNLLGDFSGFNFFYFGCAVRPGTSSIALNPFP